MSVTARQRRSAIFVNPIGGRAAGPSIVHDQLLPALRAAGHDCDVYSSAYAGHAVDTARSFDLAHYDQIVCAGGDGLVHELINGLAARPDATDALRTPIAIVPCGSQNAIAGALCLRDLRVAILAACKGEACDMDACTATPVLASSSSGVSAAPTRWFAALLWGYLSDVLGSALSPARGRTARGR